MVIMTPCQASQISTESTQLQPVMQTKMYEYKEFYD